MSGRTITLLKTLSGEKLGGVVGALGKAGKGYLTGAGHLGGAAARKAGGGVIAQGLGTTAGLATAVAAPVLLARKTNIGRKVERATGKALGSAGSLSERALTPGDWGTRRGETY